MLLVRYTFLATKLQHRASWRHPRSRHWHQLILVTGIWRKSSLNCVLITHINHNALRNTHHSLVGTKVRLQSKRTQCSKQKGHPRINTAGTKLPDMCTCSANTVDENLDVPNKQCRREMEHHSRRHLQLRYGGKIQTDLKLESLFWNKRSQQRVKRWLTTRGSEKGQKRCTMDRSAQRKQLLA